VADALVAQLAEHHHGKVGVNGSNPFEGSFFVPFSCWGAWWEDPPRSMTMAKDKKGPVEKIALQCTECKQKNYTTEKNRRNTQGKLELNKYCPFERKHTLHREAKIK
jgi:large subunit ribosomal protein L33